MHIRNKPPVFVPAEYRAEIEQLSKAALMDVIWDMAKQLTPPDDDGHEAHQADVIGIVRSIVDIVKTHRRVIA